MAISVAFGDDVLRRFANQIGAIGQGRARPGLARAVNRVTTMARTRVIRSITRTSSIPRRILVKAVKQRGAQFRGDGPLEGVVFASGSPISLKYFSSRQLSFGVRAKVYGQWTRFPGAFMGPRPGVIAPALGGHVFVRTTAARFPIERMKGPSVPEELVKDASSKAFEQVIESHLPGRVAHELGRLLPS